MGTDKWSSEVGDFIEANVEDNPVGKAFKEVCQGYFASEREVVTAWEWFTTGWYCGLYEGVEEELDDNQ